MRQLESDDDFAAEFLAGCPHSRFSGKQQLALWGFMLMGMVYRQLKMDRSSDFRQR